MGRSYIYDSIINTINLSLCSYALPVNIDSLDKCWAGGNSFECQGGKLDIKILKGGIPDIKSNMGGRLDICRYFILLLKSPGSADAYIPCLQVLLLILLEYCRFKHIPDAFTRAF